MNIGRHVNFLSITIAVLLVIILCSIISLSITACMPKEQTKPVSKEDMMVVPEVIKDSAYVIRLITDFSCDVYYWVDIKVRICMTRTCGSMQSMLTQEQCDRIIETYIKAEK